MVDERTFIDLLDLERKVCQVVFVDMLVRSLSGRGTPTTGRGTPVGQSPQARIDGLESSPTLSRLRISSESPVPNGTASLAQQQGSNGRASSERSRIKLFGRSSSDHERSEISDPRQSDDAKSGNSLEIMVYPDPLPLPVCLPCSYFSLPLFHRTRPLSRNSTSS